MLPQESDPYCRDNTLSVLRASIVLHCLLRQVRRERGKQNTADSIELMSEDGDSNAGLL